MKAVIEVGGKQYIVTKGQTLQVDRLTDGTTKLALEPLMVFDDKDVKVGAPVVKGAKVEVKVLEAEVKAKKVQFIRYKSKKRVHKVGGHRQQYSVIEITSIA
ncbi:MAG TPA: 50S ribosomal protein L21 [Candidatus Saccharimonadales bacterium]|nr:50S ribosomal protein L21 [Candidatus Saccharimonadales bacterium]